MQPETSQTPDLPALQLRNPRFMIMNHTSPLVTLVYTNDYTTQEVMFN